MKSFPSTVNESGAMYGNHKGTSSWRNTFDVERIKALNLNTSLPVIKEQLKPENINAGNFQAYPSMSTLFFNSVESDTSSYNENKRIFYENPLMLPANAIALAKDYDWIYKYRVNSLASSEKSGDSLKLNITSSTIVPSMFNPMFGVSAMGLIRNTPLLNDFEMDQYDKNIDDCSIRTLCSLSKMPNSPIGMHRFKYADFMYCKDLGKVSNNHLVVLRKFAHPIPDHIGRGSTPQYLIGNDEWQWEIEGDVGRLISWFGTDDNKIEDIAKFSYRATWKELNAEIEQMDSNADNPNSGIIGMLSNGLNVNYNRAVGAGQVGNHSILTWLGSKMNPNVTQGIGQNNMLLRNYDNYKIYTPKNTIQSNHLYEGKLEFSHEFTLTFSYELRAYDNINPRSAFLDLLGNILEVTYRRGKFWGGSRKVIGPSQDTSMFNKVNKFIDGTIDKIPGWLASFAAGGLNFSKIMGTISSGAIEIFNGALDQAKSFMAGATSGQAVAQKVAGWMVKMNNEHGFTEAVKGMLKNALGRPQIYAWHSLVSGDDVGLWHVTVGNPKAPILSIGNLILMNAEIQQSGPLGVDDFPTQLKVIVTLKHPRPRDISDIGRMYTGGTNALYHVLSGHQIEDFYSSNKGTPTNSENAQDIKEQTTESLKTDGKKINAENSPADKHAEEENLSGLDELRHKEHNQFASSSLFVPTTQNSGLPDPSITSVDDINMMRKNTWSDAVFTVMMQEVA